MKLQDSSLNNAMDNSYEINRTEDNNSEDEAPSLLDPDSEDLPTSLIVTNLDVKIFNDEEERLKFEELFREFDEDITFQYFKSFRRARVNFCSSSTTARARIQLHQAQVCEKTINCYFAQPMTPKCNGNHPYLEPPAPVKQFLISPPASPPVGWEPVDEAEPVINYDLIAAIANLAPGEAHELHPPSETQPGIVVHICEEEEKKEESLQRNAAGGSGKPKIIPTKRPDIDT